MAAQFSLRSAITALRRFYGNPAPPVSRDPFRLILWEQVGYLVADAQRQQAYTALQRRVGLTPKAILAATADELRAIARLGGAIAASARGARLRQTAELVVGRWDGNLRTALKLPTARARRALAEFPMIGEPGADKILVFTRTARLLALDSNGLRVLQRLGLTTQAGDYRASYRRAQEALAPSLHKDFEGLIATYSLLRMHGQELCRRGAPDCPRCPLRVRCPSSTAPDQPPE